MRTTHIRHWQKTRFRSYRYVLFLAKTFQWIGTCTLSSPHLKPILHWRYAVNGERHLHPRGVQFASTHCWFFSEEIRRKNENVVENARGDRKWNWLFRSSNWLNVSTSVLLELWVRAVETERLDLHMLKFLFKFLHWCNRWSWISPSCVIKELYWGHTNLKVIIYHENGIIYAC